MKKQILTVMLLTSIVPLPTLCIINSTQRAETAARNAAIAAENDANAKQRTEVSQIKSEVSQIKTDLAKFIESTKEPLSVVLKIRERVNFLINELKKSKTIASKETPNDPKESIN